jgi:hypothetical protein
VWLFSVANFVYSGDFGSVALLISLDVVATLVIVVMPLLLLSLLLLWWQLVSLIVLLLLYLCLSMNLLHGDWNVLCWNIRGN